MRTPIHYRQGEYINPAIQELLDKHNPKIDAALQGIDESNTEAPGNPRYRKHTSVSRLPSSMGLVTRRWANAMQFSTSAGADGRLRGMLLLFSTVALPMSIWLLIAFGTDSLLWGVFLDLGGIFGVFGFLFISACLLFGLYMTYWITAITFRFELFRPLDEPTIFDREHRKVYRFFVDYRSGLLGAITPAPLVVIESDWDLIDVEHETSVASDGSTVKTAHRLNFLVRKSADDPLIVDLFSIGDESTLVFDSTVDALWEHIRRYMEEDGPAIEPGMARKRGVVWPIPLRQSFYNFTPFSPVYRRRWKTHTGWMLLAHVLLPVSLPVMILWRLYNWLAFATSYPVTWPQEILDALGEPISDTPAPPSAPPAAAPGNAKARRHARRKQEE